MKDWTHKDIFDTAWKHFAVISDQRLKTYNFYVVLLTASIGATLAAIEKKTDAEVLLACAVFSMVCSLVFAAIDYRTRRLIEIPKRIMLALEVGDHWPAEYRLFTADAEMMKHLKCQITSYTAAFRLSFVAHFAFGWWVLWRSCTWPHN